MVNKRELRNIVDLGVSELMGVYERLHLNNEEETRALLYEIDRLETLSEHLRWLIDVDLTSYEEEIP